MRHHLALVVCLVVTGSVAHAEKGRHARHHKKAKQAKHKKVEKAADRPDDALVGTKLAGAEPDERVALREDSDDVDEEAIDMEDEESSDVTPVRVRKTAKRARKPWHVAFGPYLWASSVDADVSLGPASVSTGVDFMSIQRHAKFGAELLGEVGFGRLTFYGDMMYGVVGLDGATSVGPVMVSLDGEATSLMLDGAAGYRVYGDERSVLSVEPRIGARYQRTAITGNVDVLGADALSPDHVDAAADGLAGAKVVVRPFWKIAVSGVADYGVVGMSTKTWSAAADASVRIGSHVRFSLGWRTLTTERTNVAIRMHGPRVALELLF